MSINTRVMVSVRNRVRMGIRVIVKFKHIFRVFKTQKNIGGTMFKLIQQSNKLRCWGFLLDAGYF